MPVQWGIIGPGNIAAAFADGLKDADAGNLAAIASRSTERLQAFGEQFGVAPHKRYQQYSDLVADPDIDAVYIATPHPWHAEHSILALRAGKHVLCEKPAGMFAAQVRTVTEIAQQQQCFFMEAFMYRGHPQIATMLDWVRRGRIGKVQHIEANFCFAAPVDAAGRLYNPELGGGAILDVGCYPVSIARLIAGIAIGKHYDEPTSIKAVGRIGSTGVDETTRALLMFPSGITASCTTSVAEDLGHAVRIIGTDGVIEIPEPWLPGDGRQHCDSCITIECGGTVERQDFGDLKHLYSYEAQVASQAIGNGQLQADSPALNWSESIANAYVLDQWRQEIGYVVAGEDSASIRTIPGVLPDAMPAIPMHQFASLDKPVSTLVLGCDNQRNIGDAALLWDAWIEAGGNAFDTAHIYENGKHETMLGQWMATRGLSDQLAIIVKGAHSPYCTPRSIETELDESLDRLGIDSAPIYIMHRDNPAVPVDEFADVLAQLQAKRKIQVFGGSNWSIQRMQAAREYAADKAIASMQLLNNNLSLAVMQKPVWPGCVSSNDSTTLDWLEREEIAHLSWSSQARGYFLQESLRNRLPQETSPINCYDCADNQERRRRTESIASDRNLSSNSVALAWVLAQDFPSLALIGPRTAGELSSSLSALTCSLSDADVRWLNLC